MMFNDLWKMCEIGFDFLGDVHRKAFFFSQDRGALRIYYLLQGLSVIFEALVREFFVMKVALFLVGR